MKAKIDYILNGIQKRIILYIGIVRGQFINMFYRNIKIAKSTCVGRGVKFDNLNGGMIIVGTNCRISRGVCLITEGGNITIGDNCSFNPYAMIYGQGDLVIGNGVRIATHSVIIPSNHNFNDKNKFIYEQGLSKKGIQIKDNVWIGANSVILDGTILETGSIIAAGAVVSRSTEKFSINAGVPSKQLKQY